MFPMPDAKSLAEYYGQPWKVTSDSIVLDPLFEKVHIMRIRTPYKMKYAGKEISQIAVNKKCAESLGIVLEKIGKTLNASEREFFQLDQFGGSFNFRPIRGVNGALTANKLSLHAYGAAIDLAPQLNPLGVKYDPAKKMIPHEVIEIFKKEGWGWGGDFKARPDCMHFQATR